MPIPAPSHADALSRLASMSTACSDSLPAGLVMRFFETDLLTQAAALSFYALLSLAPLLVLLLWLDGFAVSAGAAGAVPADRRPWPAAAPPKWPTPCSPTPSNQPDVGSLAGIWSTLLLFIGATAVFARLQNALNLIFNDQRQRLDGIVAWLRKRVLSFGVVLALGFLLIVSMAVATACAIVLRQGAVAAAGRLARC